MSGYNDQNPCPKCGGRFIRTRYVEQGDFLARKCERCEYKWREEPLDRAEPEVGEPVSYGRLGGLARAANMAPERRSEIARLAARARWSRRDAS